MKPEELKYYIEQYEARKNGDQKTLIGWSDKFLIETIQRGLHENGYDISFINKEGKIISGEDAIDGFAGGAFNKAIDDFKEDFRNKKFEKEDLAFEFEVVPTSEILKEGITDYRITSQERKKCPLPLRRHRIISRKLVNKFLTFKKAMLCVRANFQNPNGWLFWPNMMLGRV